MSHSSTTTCLPGSADRRSTGSQDALGGDCRPVRATVTSEFLSREPVPDDEPLARLRFSHGRQGRHRDEPKK